MIRLYAFFLCTAGCAVSFTARAQTTLAPVSPGTDWLGVAIVSALGLLFVAVAAYIVHIKRSPGLQFGEAELERLADLIHRKQSPAPSPDPLTFDGIKFANQTDLDNYKAAKATIDTYRQEH